MNRRNFLGAAAASAAFRAPASQAATRKPNIVIILADDFGYGSLNCNGADPKLIRTPNLDRIAKEGVRFTDANTPSSVCSPSRYGLLTGRYCWRTSLQYEVLPTNAPLHIETTRLTIPSLLKGEGYSTAAIGKWHLGYGTAKTDFTRELKPGPLEVGFDYHFGVPQNHGDASGIYVENHWVAGLRSDKHKDAGLSPYGRPFMGIDAPQRVDDEVMDVLTDHAVDWIGKQNLQKPFFLYFTPVAVHDPVTPSKRARGSSAAGPYGDWIHDLDYSIGRVLKALDDHNFTQDTLFIFTSDNGGVLQTEGDRAQAVAYRAGLHVNGNWRGGKHGIYQGGFRVPFLVRWPGRVPAQTVSDQVICLTDLVATFAGLLQVPLPKGNAEDSFDVMRAFTEEKPGPPVRDHVILQSASAIYDLRQGDWKFIERADAPTFTSVRNPKKAEAAERRKARAGQQPDELYNLKTDPAETRNIIAANAGQAAKLKKLLVEASDRGYTRPGAGD